jgi:chemotaxis protein histidine kinase CheA
VMWPSTRTGPRQVSQRPPAPPTAPAMRAQAVMAQPPMRMPSAASSVSPSSAPFRRRRSSGWLLVAGLVGLVGLGSAVLAARGSWSAAAPSVRMPTAEAPSSETPPSVAEPAAKDAPEEEVAAAPAAAAPEAESDKTEAAEAAQPEAAQLAKYDDTQASAFVAGVEHSKVGEGNTAPASAAKAERVAAAAEKQEVSSASQRRLDAAHKSEKAEKAEKARAEKAEKAEKARAEKAEKAEKLAQEREKQAALSKRAVAAVVAPPAPPKPPKAEAAAPAAEPANASVNEAAAAALATSANLASSCRPRGGPSGAGKTRVIYSQDGEVQSVEILTAKFRDTLTGSCVKMVFRRAKIPAFKGEPPTFIKSFTIPEE